MQVGDHVLLYPNSTESAGAATGLIVGRESALQWKVRVTRGVAVADILIVSIQHLRRLDPDEVIDPRPKTQDS